MNNKQNDTLAKYQLEKLRIKALEKGKARVEKGNYFLSDGYEVYQCLKIDNTWILEDCDGVTVMYSKTLKACTQYIDNLSQYASFTEHETYYGIELSHKTDNYLKIFNSVKLALDLDGLSFWDTYGDTTIIVTDRKAKDETYKSNTVLEVKGLKDSDISLLVESVNAENLLSVKDFKALVTQENVGYKQVHYTHHYDTYLHSNDFGMMVVELTNGKKYRLDRVHVNDMLYTMREHMVYTIDKLSESLEQSDIETYKEYVADMQTVETYENTKLKDYLTIAYENYKKDNDTIITLPQIASKPSYYVKINDTTHHFVSSETYLIDSVYLSENDTDCSIFHKQAFDTLNGYNLNYDNAFGFKFYDESTMYFTYYIGTYITVELDTDKL